MKNLNNRAKLLIAFALIVVIAVAAMIVSNLNQKDEGPALPSPLGVSVSLHMNEEGLNSLFSGSGRPSARFPPWSTMQPSGPCWTKASSGWISC